MTTISEGKIGDFELLLAVFKNEFDHIWVQDFERHGFRKYKEARKRTKNASNSPSRSATPSAVA